jgi:hypothetical protein
MKKSILVPTSLGLPPLPSQGKLMLTGRLR